MILADPELPGCGGGFLPRPPPTLRGTLPVTLYLNRCNACSAVRFNQFISSAAPPAQCTCIPSFQLRVCVRCKHMCIEYDLSLSLSILRCPPAVALETLRLALPRHMHRHLRTDTDYRTYAAAEAGADTDTHRHSLCLCLCLCLCLRRRLQEARR